MPGWLAVLGPILGGLGTLLGALNGRAGYRHRAEDRRRFTQHHRRIERLENGGPGGAAARRDTPA